MSNFEYYLSNGKAGESKIAKWLMRKGYSILPVYEKEINEGKGPQVFTQEGELIAPDLLVFNQRKVRWIEAKHKSIFSWHRISQKWVTGVDLHHYKHYIEIAKISPWPVYLLFLHKEEFPNDHPDGKPSPTGLFGGLITDLMQKENHRHGNWGKTGMVYWAYESLTQYAYIGEFENLDEYEIRI